MATGLEYPPHFEDESKALGASADQIRAGKRLAELYAENDPLVDAKEVAVTAQNPKFRPWLRLKSERMTVRTVIERVVDVSTSDETIVVHAVLPRWSETYDEIKALWKKYRSRVT